MAEARSERDGGAASGSPSSTRRSRSKSGSVSSISTSARAQVRPAAEAVTSAAEARRVVQERFAAGVATSTDLLDAQQDQLEAELQRTRALANVKLAEARLARALGQ